MANNPKVVSMGIGNTGIKEVVKGGFIVSIFISAGFHAVDQLMDDERTWHHFVGNVAVDVVIAAAASGISWGLAAATIGATSMVTVGPLLAIVLFGTVVTFGVSFLIDSEAIKNQLVEALIFAEFHVKKAENVVNQVKKENNNNPIHFVHKLFGIPLSIGI